MTAYPNSIRLRAWLVPVLILMLLGFSGCTAADPILETVPTVPTSAPVQETAPPPTAPPDGDPDNVTCQGSYTVSDDDFAAAADRTVATVGDAALTNRMLHIYYCLEVSEYLSSHPDAIFDQPLDTLLCELDDTAVTWQQYFLQRALKTWHTQQSLSLRAANVSLFTEKAYQPNMYIHGKHISESMPGVNYLYGYVHRSYQPNDMHQEYLDNLPALLEELAGERGFEGADALVRALAGSCGDVQPLLDFVGLYNLGYMYYTQLTYDMAPTAEELEAYSAEHPAEAETDTSVSIRHILLTPQGAETAPDGTVTASEDAWEQCRTTAEELLSDWSKEVSRANPYFRAPHVDEALFAELAVANSSDAGSRINGGLYSGLRRGQLVDALDTWCFAPERANGDTALIRTECGYHLVYFVSSQNLYDIQAEEAVLLQQTHDLIQSAMAEYPMEVDYSSICLGFVEHHSGSLTAEELLYPDIAHERFPIAPLYLQQDYPTTMYGYYPITSHGCGITTLSMLASYMTDDELTPPELCAIYGYYCSNEGSNYIMFDQTPAELGFYLATRSKEWTDVENALKNGQVAVSLQHRGYWTRGGHFILMQELNEDGLVMVRDSNLFNFGKLVGHEIDYHDPNTIPRANAMYWIYNKKVVRIPACERCDDTNHEDVASAMFTGSYLCVKCTDAMQRRGDFLEACAAVK